MADEQVHDVEVAAVARRVNNIVARARVYVVRRRVVFEELGRGLDDAVLDRQPERRELRLLVDMREYDVPYQMRVSIDLDLRCGSWYTVHAPSGDEDEGGGNKGN